MLAFFNPLTSSIRKQDKCVYNNSKNGVYIANFDVLFIMNLTHPQIIKNAQTILKKVVSPHASWEFQTEIINFRESSTDQWK